MHAHFLGLQRHHSLGVCDHRYENQLQDLREDPKEEETVNHVRWGKNPTHPATIATDLKSFHNVPTTWMWQCLTFGCLLKCPPLNCVFS
jgi:hypothetical protein